ncbi:sel1 repeat family protein [Pelomyxa schiedti]|nr:sel1 repeat family protein [Pelomyxa schiedti]
MSNSTITTSTNDNSEYVRRLTDMVAAGDTYAMESLAECYLCGEHGVPHDAAKGLALLQRASSGGNACAMLMLAWYHWEGSHGLPRDMGKAHQLYEAVPRGMGLWSLGNNYYYGYRVDRDVHKAVSLWKKGAELGDHQSMVELGWCYKNGHAAKITGANGVWLNVICVVRVCTPNEDDGNAQAYLGWCYLWGCGVERDVSKAIELFNSTLPNQRAEDINRAKELYNNAKLCHIDCSTPLTELGVHFLRGDCGAPTDKRAAVGYFRMGAEVGDPVSMFHLGVCLRDGDGVDCDVKESRLWLEKAARLEHRGAQKIIAPQHKSTTSADDTTVEHNTTESCAPATTPTSHKNAVLEGHNNLTHCDCVSLRQQCESMKQIITELEEQKEKLLKGLVQANATLSQHQTAVDNLQGKVKEEVEKETLGGLNKEE